jgi:hypothetical protein
MRYINIFCVSAKIRTGTEYIKEITVRGSLFESFFGKKNFNFFIKYLRVMSCMPTGILHFKIYFFRINEM